jgi:hypothetical protein
MGEGVITTRDEIVPAMIIIEPVVDETGEYELFKSLHFMKDRFEFIEKDEEGLKMRVRNKFIGGEFPYEIGFVVVSDYDDRKFLITQTDPQNLFIWFGSWE